MIRSLWAKIQGDPVFMRQVHGWLTIFWLLMAPVSIFTSLKSSIIYLVGLSIYAIITGHWSSWQSARVEVTQSQEAEERLRQPVEAKVVEKIIAETNIQPCDPLEG